MTQPSNDHFNDDQKNYLQGFVTGADTARTVRGLPTLANAMDKLIGRPVNLTRNATSTAASVSAIGPDAAHHEAWCRTEREGGKLCKEEKAKRDKSALDMWTQMQEDARAGQFPKGTDVFLYKYHGLFFVAPAQNAYMCRLRFAGGLLTAHQFKGVAELAERFGGGYSHVTTRANLQIREIGAENGVNMLPGLENLGIIIRGSGADNIRNITASPTAGIDPQELIDTRPLARELHHHILHHRDMYGLPRKFNIAFDGGGRVSSVADTNDIGFMAVRIKEAEVDESLPGGVYFRMELGGITGHGDFSRDSGILLKPEECIPAATAVVKTFIGHGDRTNREKARLKYLLDAWGYDRFLTEAEKELPFKWRRVELSKCEQRQPTDRFGHIGAHRQKQEGYSYIGVSLPVGKMQRSRCEGWPGSRNDSARACSV